MAFSTDASLFQVVLFLVVFAPICCFSHKLSCPVGGSSSYNLYPEFYDRSCPRAKKIVKSVVAKAVAKEARMAASLLRLYFHDLRRTRSQTRTFVRGFDVIDDIKSSLEKKCPKTVSCADIFALAASDSTVLLKFQHTAPSNTFHTILTKFKLKGLNVVDLVALSGSHTKGHARCTSFKQRLYGQSSSKRPDFSLNQFYANQLRARCPRSGGDQNLFVMDFASPTKFDNYYYKNLLASKGLFSSDQVLTKNQASMKLVKKYAENNKLFFKDFAESMVKMGNITPLKGLRGEIRKSRRRINSN
ncbi:hypothetical protein MKX03_005288 [Papaver bracteatum]|nr:hypothetical protein MKX03_005288 [Papaver bracteatum]